MAIPRGGFSISGGSGGGGAYSYATTAASYPQFYGGTFLIDTGYDDPVTWTVGVDAAEVYAARVYATAGDSNPPVTTGTDEGTWLIAATPVWYSSLIQDTSAATISRRIYIQCECYLVSPPSTTAGSYYTLEQVDWSLYRI